MATSKREVSDDIVEVVVVVIVVVVVVVVVVVELVQGFQGRCGRYVLIIHFYVESGQKIIQFNIQFKIESKIFIQ